MGDVGGERESVCVRVSESEIRAGERVSERERVIGRERYGQGRERQREGGRSEGVGDVGGVGGWVINEKIVTGRVSPCLCVSLCLSVCVFVSVSLSVCVSLSSLCLSV
jgi:hypothetical protein